MKEKTFGVLEELISASFDKEVAEIRGDEEVKTEAGERINSATIRADEQGVSCRVIGDVQYVGRRDAALEEGRDDLRRIYEEVLDKSQDESF